LNLGTSESQLEVDKESTV